jgi:hypothetical protein
MSIKRTFSSVQAAVTELVPTPAERTAQQLAKEAAKAQKAERVKVGVTAAGGEEKVREKKEL